jgi:hypothetical protein
MIVQLNVEHTSGGLTASCKTHAQYLQDFGDGNSIDGIELMVERILLLYRTMCGEETEEGLRLLELCSHWVVMGKKDGYKAKKLDVGRTIQAPCFEMKVLWKLCFGLSDDTWIHSYDSWVHAGEDFDHPVTGAKAARMRRARSSGALDAAAFDRYMMPEYITTFFDIHMSVLAGGAPKALLDSFKKMVLYGPLVMSDGVTYWKTRGNPSGFMNTLRLNCWANLVAWCYIVARRLKQLGESWTSQDVFHTVNEDLFFEICGDDSRVWALTELGDRILDVQNEMQACMTIWNEELPWSVKLEGCAVLDLEESFETRILKAPSMVSRRLFVVNGVLWEPLVDASRAVRRLVHAEGRTWEEDAELVVSAFETLAYPLFLCRQGKLASASLEFLWREFGNMDVEKLILRRVCKLMHYC